MKMFRVTHDGIYAPRNPTARRDITTHKCQKAVTTRRMSRMRIAHLETSTSLGGQELRICDQVQWLLSRGHAAWLLVQQNSTLFEEATRRRLPVHPVPFRGSLHPQAVAELIRFTRREKIHLLDCHSSSAASTAAAARMFGCRWCALSMFIRSKPTSCTSPYGDTDAIT